jgi:hypothetical protein
MTERACRISATVEVLADLFSLPEGMSILALQMDYTKLPPQVILILKGGDLPEVEEGTFLPIGSLEITQSFSSCCNAKEIKGRVIFD